MYNGTTRSKLNQESSDDVCPIPRQGGNNNFYAQFYEDYILSIVFSDIEKGFYVDIGANSPNFDSITKHFYLKGWNGINIEPIKKWSDQYLIERPNDININTGVSNFDGEMDFYVLSSDLMSSGNLDFVNKAEKKGYSYEKQIIKVRTLDHVLEKYQIPPITFLKIDVEGMEKQILEGLNLSKYRPIVLIIESIRPFSHIKVHDGWESILIKNNFAFMFFDSLNRYYLAKEHFNKFSPNFEKAAKCCSLAQAKYPEHNLENVFKHELDY